MGVNEEGAIRFGKSRPAKVAGGGGGGDANGKLLSWLLGVTKAEDGKFPSDGFDSSLTRMKTKKLNNEVHLREPSAYFSNGDRQPGPDNNKIAIRATVVKHFSFILGICV